MSKLNSFTTYVTYWDNNPLDMIKDMINNMKTIQNMRIILAFASFNFSSTEYIPGFGSLTLDQVKQITDLVHNNNASISLSIGGATYPFVGSNLYSRPGDLANNINIILNKCNFDGVDFDIEDSNVPSDFVNNTSSLINTLRNLNNKLYISLTTAAQAWGAIEKIEDTVSLWQKDIINYTIGNLNAWQPMEYDIWIDPTNPSYLNQIQYDINYYIDNWGVDPKKIILGLMPGKDDIGHNLSLSDALNLTTFAMNRSLQGVMTWDATIDSKGCDGNAPYAYSMGIISQQNKQYENKCWCL